MASLGFVTSPALDLPDDLDADFVEPYLMGRFVGPADDGSTRVLPDPLRGLGGLPVLGGAVLFPGSMTLADPATPLAVITDHLDRVAESLAAAGSAGGEQAGGEQGSGEQADRGWVVLGSGASRTIPDHVDRQVGLERLAEVVREATARLGAVGYDVLVEPLRQQESNVFTTLAETGAFLDDHGLGNRMVCDTFHLFSQAQTSADAVAQVRRIGHVHLSGHDRLAVHRDEQAVFEVSDALVEAGYVGRFSLECSWPNGVDDVRADLEVSRRRLP
ncbi:sugar phosphate isomerase/epimerase family protein [Aestuariimicrobium soli]|uniref:sugar phosphate isomerase/epimerase family protein n=1 Tax=Aestuariimicrobium soli TaxID=2035834 RepID=UPI003EBB55A0